jgi:hypothetical protein
VPIAPNESFMEAVFAFVFGRGHPNGDLETRRRRALALLLRANHGAVYAEQVRRGPTWVGPNPPATHSLTHRLARRAWTQPPAPCRDRARERAQRALETAALDHCGCRRSHSLLAHVLALEAFDLDRHVYTEWPSYVAVPSRPHANTWPRHMLACHRCRARG